MIVSHSEIEMARHVIARGGILAYPTETVYGLGASAYNEQAVSRIFQLKERQAHRPVLLLIRDQAMLSAVVVEIPKVAEQLMEQFWPGPLTLIFSARHEILHAVTGGTEKVGVRISSHPFVREFMKNLDAPLISTSANPSGQPSARTAGDVLSYFPIGIDYIVAGETGDGEASTVIDVSENRLSIIREGKISRALLN